ncbi:hypothetical protein GCM10010172_65070 [Paractinoplanes ferrugineus]|uniref:Carrier domain-containing protein n=1 Tax=Paractinoplanes ferrugineus TaxID=113564 RepID=A0A919J5E4_9ACTN|nr:phosphopantetheine-binding protein [Actinoplanes ferrugineus]GIE13333.1 hypothetical protein Afe05nite_51730 [Actinoplanes ferrugineus]
MSTGRPPGDDVERVVALTWTEFLDEPVTDVTKSIFTLGAHSLLVARCRGRLQDIFGVHLETGPFFAHPTIEGFCAAITAGPAGARIRRRAAVAVRVLTDIPSS